MKFSIFLCLLLLQLKCLNARLLTKSDGKFIRGRLTGPGKSAHNSDFFIQGKQRPLFARRMYERQRVYEMRPRVRPAYPKGPPPKVAKLPDAPRCTEVSEGCLPNSRCCDPCASCQCRFFNTICFCRKTNSMCRKKA
ncbi:agouti-signaling protein-like [Gadus macrocephalus]|uniref:agouti-signaling protein-like n=1 Tax=Gadus macrocephalus TaxID=80720 RepID=UPI0028CBAC26|nr:agouti-signaling protein-like [Gadus macrocephalus]